MNLQMTSYGSYGEFRLLLWSKRFAPSRVSQGEVTFSFVPENAPRTGGALFGTVERIPSFTFQIRFIPLAREHALLAPVSGATMAGNAQSIPLNVDFENAIESLTVDVPGQSVSLRLGRMSKPLEAMRHCVDTMIAYWGADAQVQRTLTRRALPDPETIRRVQARYPVSMAAGGQSAYIPVRVMVDSAGNPGECVVQIPSTPQAFKNAACYGLAGKFSPALDHDGRPVSSVFITHIFYQY